ncbi:MAG: zinc-finger domain-containing protein [Gammaproteobacteria bacterium]|nr:zinc-finger domain-containing protein [Gammaproteobacteria bacterium]
MKPPNAEPTYTVTPDDLPLHCPLPEMYLWNSHPKVYLPIEQTGEAKCPYCSASYRLVREPVASEPVQSHRHSETASGGRA